MKVVLVGSGMIPIPPPAYGAVEKHVWNLGQALEAKGHDVTIVNDVFGERSIDEYRFGLWAAKSVRGMAADVVHLHTPGVALAFSLRGPRDYVFTTHSRHWATREGLGENVGFALEKRACRAARLAIAVSPFVGKALQDLGVLADVIPNGVDVAKYAPRRPARTGKRVVGVGEIARHKRWHEAAAAIQGLNAHLTLAGPFTDPEYATRIEAAAPEQVTLLGPVSEDELVSVLGEGDILVHPSVSESFGMAVVEGMAAGLPVVASDVVSHLVTESENGFLVASDLPEPDRVIVLRKAIDLLLADGPLRRTFGEVSRGRAIERYSWATVADLVSSAYERAAARR